MTRARSSPRLSSAVYVEPVKTASPSRAIVSVISSSSAVGASSTGTMHGPSAQLPR